MFSRFSELPIDLGSLTRDSSYSAVVSVCDYIEENGERDDLLEGSITIEYNDKYTHSLPGLTPVLNISEDTGIIVEKTGIFMIRMDYTSRRLYVFHNRSHISR